MTNTRNAPVEVIESAYPFFIHQYGLVPESSGAGKFRDGFGMVRDIEIQSEQTTVTVSSDRFDTRPWGLLGGQDAKRGSAAIIHSDRSQEQLSSKVTRRIKRGDRLVSVTPGGGGWGHPKERSPEEVRRDVVEELRSLEAALDVYRVVLREDLSVDWEATRLARQKSDPV
jgi:N-methylhydantoinase B